MNPNLSKAWRCNECGELHTCEDDAKVCCAPNVSQVVTWKCDECGYETENEEEARYCCLDEDVVLPATPAQLEAAGQQRLAL
jgi:hypothetical protein